MTNFHHVDTYRVIRDPTKLRGQDTNPVTDDEMQYDPGATPAAAVLDVPGAPDGYATLEVHHQMRKRGVRAGTTAFTWALVTGCSMQSGYWVRYCGKVRPADVLANYLHDVAQND